MTCPGCKKELLTENGGRIIEALGRKYHADCFKCSKCRATIKGNFGEHNGVVVCKSCIGVTCAGCQGTISSGGFVEIGGKSYHEGCVPAGGVGETSSGCATCGKELTGDCVSTDGLSYHAQCFVCTTCKEPLKSQFFNYEGKTYCKLCRVTARMDKQSAAGEKMNAREANRDNQTILGSKLRKADGTFAPSPSSNAPPEAKPAYIPAHAKNNPMPSSSASPAASSSPSYGGSSNSYGGSGGGYASGGGSKPSSATVGASAISAAPASNAPAKAAGGGAGGTPAFCPECGTKAIVGRAFCGECGHKFGTPPVEKVELPSNYEDLQRRFNALKTEDD